MSWPRVLFAGVIGCLVGIAIEAAANLLGVWQHGLPYTIPAAAFVALSYQARREQRSSRSEADR